jgi:asparagine synthase (glutamine-hydrolysing)
MCGLFAAVGCDLPASALENVFRLLHHRGPDGSGLFVDESAKLTIAHTRLAVIDLVTGSQPLESEDGNIVLAANGEIYDFERVRASLEAKGHRFGTHSDSEVILHLYEEFGLGCFDHLRGEFTFLLYDRTNRTLVAARDRFGIKPLYFSRVAGGFVFASEMKAIFASALVAPKLNAAAFDPLADRDFTNAQFPFEGIEHVPPACYLAIDLETGESTISRYWSSEIPAATADPMVESTECPGESADAVLHELEQAVRLRLRSDVPVGLYLSGGIDSAFVGALMKRNLPSRLHSFSISFEGSGRNEGEQARRAAEFLGSDHHDLPVSKQMLWDNLEECLWHSELPFVTLAPVGKFLLSRSAKRFVTVVLTGEGADEVFLGYRSFFQKAIRDTRTRGPVHKRESAQLRRLKQGPLGNAVLQKFSLLLFNPRQRQGLRQARSAALAPISAKPLINAVQEARIAGMPLDILCYLGDREEMAHSVEARLPFLDHVLYELAKSIPVDLKVRGGVEKAVLREAAKGVLPDDLRLRRKTGFMATSETADLFGSDRRAASAFQAHLTRAAFTRAGVFSYRAYLAARMIAKLPPRTRRLDGLRRSANKVIMYMMQVHMLHEMFIADPRWAKPVSGLTKSLFHETAPPPAT